MVAQSRSRARAARAGISGASISAPSRCSSLPIRSSRRRSRSGHRMATRSHSPGNRHRSPNAKTLWLMDPDGANPRQILEGNNLTRWLPDGSGIVYQSLKILEIFLYDLATGRSRQISTQPDVVEHAHAESGRTVDRLSGHGPRMPATSMFTRSVCDGGQPRVVASTPRQDFHPFFSPSGRWVYFQPDHKNLYRVPGPGQDWKPADPAKMTDFPESGLFLEDPQISRDGKQLLYARGKDHGRYLDPQTRRVKRGRRAADLVTILRAAGRRSTRRQVLASLTRWGRLHAQYEPMNARQVDRIASRLRVWWL